MKCSKCQTELPETANFCLKCGSDFRKIDYNHTNSFSRPESYTPKHLAEKILTSRSAIEGERKYVTVMFVDVANSTAVFEDVDPETVHQIMNGCFQIFLDAVHRYEGTINQFRGDCVMAIFGAPIAHEDHAQRACYAALGIMRAMQRYSEAVKRRHKIPFEVRIGLNTGPVVVGSIGDDLRMDYTADGDTSNLASRMESNARPGTILISPNTYKIVGKLFKIKSVGKISVKGKKDRLEVYELLDGKIDRPRIGIERQIYSDLVGRDKELHKLEQQVIKVVNGSGAVVNIIGAAGIGKSRLVAELKKQDLMGQVTLLEGKAISIGQNLSFHPIIDFLKRWARIREEDGNQTAFDKLENMIESISTEETAEILPFIATLMGIKLTGKHAQRVKGIEGEALENLVLKNFRELLIQAARNNPVGVIIEDLHWADLSSIGFLESVFRLAAGQRILFINAIRPGYEETGERIIRTLSDDLKTNYVEIRLEQLDVRSSETLINNMLKIKGLPIPVIRQIVSRSDGNPYFIEEVVRSFIDEGVVVVKDGAFEAGEKINKVVIPNTINDLLMARIDRLEEKNRELIKTASVIGRNFFYRILKGVAASIEDIDHRLSYLKNIQLILERQRLDEIEYLFTHALAQEAAYASILIEKRKSLHLEVAKTIENVFGDNIRDFYGVLSYHYLNGEDFARAEEYLIKSGEEALNSSASSEAITYFKEALRLYQDRLGKTADRDKIIYLEKSIALAYYNKGQLAESIEYFDKVLPYYGIKTSKNVIFSALQAVFCFISFVINLYFPSLRSNKSADIREVETLELWWKRSSAYSISNRIMFVKEGFRLFRHLSNYNLKTIEKGVQYLVGATALFSYGGISFALGDKVLNRVKTDVKKDDPRDILYYITFRMLHEFLSGNITEDLKYDDELVANNLKFGDVLFTTYYPIQHIFRKIEKGNFKDAIYVIQKLSELIEAYRCDYAKINLFYVNARILLKTRRLDDALNAAEEGIVYESKAGDVLVLSQIYSIKARMQILTGDIEGAEQSLENAEKVGTGIIPPLYSSEIYLSRFVLQLSKFENILNSMDKEQISEYSRKVKKSGKKAAICSKKAVYNSVEVYKYMGIYCWITNKQKIALKYWEKSITIGKNAGIKPELARTYFEVAKRLLEKTSGHKALNGIKAEDYLQRAKTMFEGMDLKWDLEQLERFTSNI